MAASPCDVAAATLAPVRSRGKVKPRARRIRDICGVAATSPRVQALGRLLGNGEIAWQAS
jgi:hypothetical protein